MDMQALSDAGLAGVLPGATGNADPWSATSVAGASGTATGTGAGRYGFSPTAIGGGVASSVQAVWDWLNTPFNRPLSATGIFAIVGSILIAILLWNLILYHIRIAAEAI
jgi:hypothetical protein